MMVIYVPNYDSALHQRGRGRPFLFHPFDGCFGDRLAPSLSNWVVPGTWPDWMR
jgi:hypothetical protein